MAYSRCGLTNALHRGTKISFVRHVNDLFLKYSIPLALFAVVRTFADGVNAEFTVIHRSVICEHFLISLPSASSERTRRWSGGPPIDRWWRLLAFNGRSHLRDQLSACWIDDLSSCCWLLGAMTFIVSEEQMIAGQFRRGPSTEPCGTPKNVRLTKIFWWISSAPSFLSRIQIS